MRNIILIFIITCFVFSFVVASADDGGSVNAFVQLYTDKYSPSGDRTWSEQMELHSYYDWYSETLYFSDCYASSANTFYFIYSCLYYDGNYFGTIIKSVDPSRMEHTTIELNDLPLSHTTDSSGNYYILFPGISLDKYSSEGKELWSSVYPSDPINGFVIHSPNHGILVFLHHNTSTRILNYSNKGELVSGHELEATFFNIQEIKTDSWENIYILDMPGNGYTLTKLDQKYNILWTAHKNGMPLFSFIDFIITDDDSLYIYGSRNGTEAAYLAEYNTDGVMQWLHIGERCEHPLSFSNLAVSPSGLYYSEVHKNDEKTCEYNLVKINNLGEMERSQKLHSNYYKCYPPMIASDSADNIYYLVFDDFKAYLGYSLTKFDEYGQAKWQRSSPSEYATLAKLFLANNNLPIVIGYYINLEHHGSHNDSDDDPEKSGESSEPKTLFGCRAGPSNDATNVTIIMFIVGLISLYLAFHRRKI